MVAEDVYELFAIRYATRGGQRRDHFVGGDPHDRPMAMDYFVWLARNQHRCFVVDTGFNAAMASKRGRQLLRTPREGLQLMGVEATDVKDIVLTHLHYDHVGTFDEFPNARFHLQDAEMSFATGRHMCADYFSHPYEVEEIVGMVRLVHGKRVSFHDGTHQLAPGISLHHIGGHTAGLQCVRVNTQRGWVVLASDASHYYEHFQTQRCFSLAFHLGDMLNGYRTLQELAQSGDHIIPGHDPLVMSFYPAPSAQLEGIVVRLDVPPTSA